MTATQHLPPVELRSLDGARFGVDVGALLPGPIVPQTGVRMVATSGWPAVEPGDEAAAWRVRAGGGLLALEEALAPLLGAGARVCLRPRASDVLSDVPSALSLLRKHGSEALEVLCAPADLITGDMLRHAADHYVRILAALASDPAVVAVVLEDVTARGADAAACVPGEGLLPPAAWAAAFEVVRASGKTVVATGWSTAERLAGLGWTLRR